MSEIPMEKFEEVLSYETELPFSWRASDAELTQLQRQSVDASNLHVLNAIAVLEDHVIESREEDGPLAQDVKRLDAKLNLLLELVGQLAAARYDMPAPTVLRFNSHGLEWTAAGNPPPIGQSGFAILHLMACPSMPLTLAARVSRYSQVDTDRTRVLFEGLSEALCEALQRLVFRHHRRAIADVRQPGHEESPHFDE